MLLRDPFAGHRNELSGAPEGNRNDWTDWDFSIAQAMQIIEDGTTEHGHLIWELEDDQVDVQAIRRIDKAAAAIDRRTSGDNYKPKPGEFYVTELTFPYLGEDEDKPKYQTRQEWLAKQMDT